VTQPRTHITAWLRASRSDATQEWLATDIERVTGWHITRDRYSKYESGSLPIGPKVLGHFVDYWQSRGVGGPDDMPPPGLGDTLAGGGAYLDLAGAIRELTEELRLLREAQVDGPAATAELVAQAIADTLRALGLVADPRRE
jgi:hypothetical protein